jgi:hypothetical protein
MDTPSNSQNALAVLAQQRLGQLPSVFRNRQGKLNDDMAGGITSGFAIVSFRGKTWRVKYQGKEDVLLNEDGRTPRFSFDVVVLKASPHISKVWYEHGYVEGSMAPPDCWSVDGKKPDPASPKLQNPTCAGCRWNAWGSSRSTAGSGKGKDCADSKRIAVVPIEDIENKRYGGPMLLRVPPASLGALLTYANSLEQIGFPYYGVVTTISFEMNQPFPQLKFEPLEALSEEEALQVESMRSSPMVDRIISAAVEEVHTDGADTTHVVPAVPRHEPPPVTVAARSSNAPKPATTPQGNVGATQDMRAQMRAMGLNEAQIIAALGHEPQPEPAPAPVDPRIAQLKAMGFNDSQIETMLAVPQDEPAPAAPSPTQAAPAEPPKRRGRGPNKPKVQAEAAPPASNGHQEPAAAPALNAGELNPAPQAEPASDLPAGFDDMLDGIIASTATKQ